MLDEVFSKKDRVGLVDTLKNFKKNTNRKNFEGLLEIYLS